MNKTLKEISEMPRDQNKIIDNAKTQLYPLTWHNIITILYEGKMRRITRRIAFEFGLCEAPGKVYKPEPNHGGARPGSGAKKLPENKKKRPKTVYFTDEDIAQYGGWERMLKHIYNCTTWKQ